MNTQNQTIELVIYRVKHDPATNKSLLLEQTSAGLAQLTGYLDRTVYQALDDPHLLVDYVAWDTLENALNGAKNMMTVPELVSFVQGIDKTLLFDHFRFADRHSVNGHETSTVELVVYQLREDAKDKIGEFFATYTSAMANAPGYQGRTLLQSTKNERLWAERVFWASPEAAAENAKVMQQNDKLGVAFAFVENVVLMKHFTELV